MASGVPCSSPRYIFTFLIMLGLAPISWVQADELPFDLTAGDISYDISSSHVVARGNVVVVGTQGRVQADTLTYDLSADTLIAEGNVIYTDPTSTTLSVKHIQLNGAMKTGILEQLRLKIPTLGEIASAREARVSGTTYEMKDVVYSPCKTCEGERKPWQIKADNVTYDQVEGTAVYRNAVMNVYDVPVMYLPWFRHPLGTKEAKNGLLPPQFGKSENLGVEATVGGYVYVPSQNADYTVRNRLMSSRGAQWQLERRQVGETHDSEIRASFLNDTGNANTKLRSHLNIVAEKDFSPTRRIGLNGEIASDDTYLNQFYRRNDPYLASTLYGEDAGNTHYAALSMTQFQDLNITRSPGQTAQMLPHLQLDKWIAMDFGGQLDLSADITNIYRGTGPRSRRMVGSADYKLPTILSDGSKLTLGGQLRADFYNVDGYTRNGQATRLLPEATAMWEKPYISADGGHTISPKILLAMSPRGGNVRDRVPNEDSVAYELDTGNLFEPSRFSGLDRVETGPRAMYGLDSRWGTADATKLRTFFGQSIRKYDDSSLPASGGASTNVSDWVGLIEASPVNWLTLNSRFRLDNSDFIPRRMDSGMRIGKTEGLNLSVNHTYLNDGPEEIYAQLNAPLSEQWAFRSEIRNDLANSRLLYAESALTWLRDCYNIEFMLRRRGFSNADVRPGTDYIVNVKLLTLGRE